MEEEQKEEKEEKKIWRDFFAHLPDYEAFSHGMIFYKKVCFISLRPRELFVAKLVLERLIKLEEEKEFDSEDGVMFNRFVADLVKLYNDYYNGLIKSGMKIEEVAKQVEEGNVKHFLRRHKNNFNIKSKKSKYELSYLKRDLVERVLLKLIPIFVNIKAGKTKSHMQNGKWFDSVTHFIKITNTGKMAVGVKAEKEEEDEEK